LLARVVHFFPMDFNRRNMDWWCERGILLLVLATLVFAPLAFGAAYVWTFLVVEMLVLGIAAVWLARLWGGHKPKLLWPPLTWALLLFVLYAVGRYFTSDNEYYARQELIRILVYSFLFLAVISNLYSQDEAETITYTLTAVAVIASSYALVQYLHHSNRVWNLTSPYPGRASGTYINPDHFAGFLELVLPLPLAFLLAARIGVITRVVLAYALVSILAGLTVTFSRGGWLAAISGILMLLGFLLCHRNHRLRAFLILLVLVGGGIVAAFILSSNIAYMRRVAKPDDTGPAVMDVSSRLQTWSGAVHMWEEHPWWGVGPGQFDTHFRMYRPERLQVRPEHAHDDYLELLTDFGLVGGVIVLGGIVIFIIGLVRTWPHVRRDENDFGSGMSTRYAFFLGGVSGLFALAVHSLVDFNLHVPANALTCVVVLALVASNLRFATKRYWVRARLPIQCVASVVLVGVAGYLAVQGWRRANETLWTIRAEHQANFSPEQADTLKKALDCEPQNYLTAYNIGECYRIESLEGSADYVNLAQKAAEYYAKACALNPFDALSELRWGMSLDWAGKHADAEKHYDLAESLDPNGNFVVANIGWHYVQVGDYAGARQWFIRANRLAGWGNDTAKSYLFDICEPKLIERASGQLPLQLFYNGKDN